ncbi:glycosyltransferase family 2 protein [Campylobacter jejuni]|uniref:Glycosyltransferase family 2 protein n=2 Tax=Campylobacter jejuni TaxID=197 RepID=A0A5T1VCI0_CAMJU|nr:MULTISPECIES: glycosyltransferase family 2 protein [Campylobacter]AJK71602.1 glycosyl transferase family 2 [Campylobacter jejuni subsp. jejuni]ALT31902.1 putative glycosyltransferase [Campylobacter jejuni subsp. jejuni]EAH4618458.1 glycosyltransferase family 2 protein [Campylobacter jejuni]EAH6390652.1 glycosyltransferase family 2 protein [Campylobacter jejuni]EAH9715998.1 glycosyltransferase family 2 protein [Campylobacter jejuni]
MIKNPKISIVVPSLNSIEYIHECIDSILKQTLKDIEIICVDAGSNDGTFEVLREYEKVDSRLKVIISDKKSYGYQINLGIKEAKGEYLGIVESDDCIKENMYENLYSIAKEKKCDIVKGDMLNFWDREERIYEYRLLNWTETLYNKILNFSIDKRILTESNIMNPSGIHKLDFIKKYNILCNETPGSAFQDTGFWFQLQVLASSIFLVKEAYYYYRQDNVNSSCNSRAKVYCICDEYDYIRNFVLKNNINEALPIISYLRYGGYNWNLSRLGEEYKQEFIQKISKDFREIQNNGEFDSSLFHATQLEILNTIINNPDEYYYNITNKPLGAVNKIKDQLSYKIGFCIVKNKNILDFIVLPIKLLSVLTKHYFEKKVKSVVYKIQPELKPKPIEEYADYYEALKIRKHLSYKLGKEILKHPFTFIFKIRTIYKEYKKDAKNNIY